MNTQPTLSGDLVPLNGDFNFRAPTLADLEALTDLYNDYWEVLFGLRGFTVDEMHRILTTPDFDLQTSMRVVIAPGGRMVGSIMVRDMASPPMHPGVFGCVHADLEGQGIGTHMLQWAIERARQAVARVPDGVRVSAYFIAARTSRPGVCSKNWI